MTAMQELYKDLEAFHALAPFIAITDVLRMVGNVYLEKEKQQIYMAYDAGDLCGERHHKEEYYNLNYGLPENSGRSAQGILLS